MPNNLPPTILTIDQILVGDGSENNDDDDDGGEEVDNDGMVTMMMMMMKKKIMMTFSGCGVVRSSIKP